MLPNRHGTFRLGDQVASKILSFASFCLLPCVIGFIVRSLHLALIVYRPLAPFLLVLPFLAVQGHAQEAVFERSEPRRP